MATYTADGRKVNVMAHVYLPVHLQEVPGSGADGIGLMEAGAFAAGDDFPSQEERLLKALAEAQMSAGDLHVTVFPSSVSAGGKGAGGRTAPPELYRWQLRAILRAAAGGSFELALPMVGQVSEIMEFKSVMAGVRAELEEEGIPCGLPAVGIMVEVPSVVPTIEVIAYESGFFVVGKNFLRFLMADDNLAGNETDFLPYYGQAFLIQLQVLTEKLSGRKHGVRFCAPFVKDPLSIPLLVGLGISQIVAPPGLIHGIKKAVESINYRDARLLAAKAISYWRPDQAREYVRERLVKLKYVFEG
ncbi:MAG: putative PEP-binding protein [Bacillota bacterium]